MSKSILKQALELVQEDLHLDGDTAQKKKSKNKEAMKGIKKGARKELSKHQKLGQERVKRNKKPDFKSSVEKYLEEQMLSKAKEKTASVPVVTNPSHIKNAKNVLEFHLHHAGRRTQETEKKEEGTVFTDRDFDKFEEEYDFFK